MTNYEKYFGTPEKAANQVIKVKESIIDNVTYELGIASGKRVGKIYENDTEESYLEWLQEECDE